MLKNILAQLSAYNGAMDRKTVIQRTADKDHVWFLRFVITPFALIQSLCSEMAKDLKDSEAVQAIIATFSSLDLYISFPVNQITAGLALPNTGRGMVLMGGPTVEEGGTVVMPSIKLSTIGVEKFLSLPQASEAAEALSVAISEELKTPVMVNLDAKIAERQITNSEAAQRRDAKTQFAARKGGYNATQKGNVAQGSTEMPAFSGASGTQGGSEDPEIPNL